MQLPAPYVPLWCKSNFSFLEGASHPEELADTCAAHGLAAMALSDRDGLYGIVKADTRCRELGIGLLVGSELSMNDGSDIVLLAGDRGGYANLCRLISLGRLRSPKGQSSVAWPELFEHAGGLLALWGGSRSLLTAGEEPGARAGPLKDVFGDRLYAILARHRRSEEQEQEKRLRRRALRYGLPLVAGVEVLYHHPARRRLHDLLLCTAHGRRIKEAGRLLPPNAGHALPGREAFSSLFADDPQAVARSIEIAGRCSFSLEELDYRYPSEELDDGSSSSQLLERLSYRGARHRYGKDIPAEARAQLDKELSVINELDYPGYFLSMHTIVEFCRNRRILCQGRGSAANSVVCYCLGITAIDPIRMGLLFERFISKERSEPPDIDLDIEHDRREEVIQFVYRRYGRERAAMVANVVRYRPRSAVRDLGKTLGIDTGRVNKLARLLSGHGNVPQQALSEAGIDADRPPGRHLYELANELLDFPRHLSIHPGGFLIGLGPISEIVPVENAAMEGRTVIQWDKYDLETLGLFKVDLLGLGALTHLRLAFELLSEHRGLELSLADVPPDDPETFEMACRADTVGVFQIESRAQMAMLPRLRPRCFYDMVIEVSLVRPGPISGGMVHPYLRRRNGKEQVRYPHPSLRPVLERTLGVPLFQEQVMRLAVVAADYTAGEADQLRRDMAAWRAVGRIERHHRRLVSRMLAKGIDEEFAEMVFDQIRGFADYGFPESHAASFALIAYATAWLKCHYPSEFTCALLNAQPMGFYSPATIVEDAKRHGIEVRPIDVTASRWDCSLERAGQSADALRMGLRYVKGLRRQRAAVIEKERGQRPFVSVDNLAHRAGLGARELGLLAEAGALEKLERERRSALWQSRAAAARAADRLALEATEPAPRFQPLGQGELVAWDYRSSWHSTRGHPLETFREELDRMGLPAARTVSSMADGSRTDYAGLVICRQRPSTAGGIVFMTLEDESGFVNVVLHRRVLERYTVLAKTAAFLGISGRVEGAESVVHLVAEHLWRPVLERGPVPAKSRDFR